MKNRYNKYILGLTIFIGIVLIANTTYNNYLERKQKVLFEEIKIIDETINMIDFVSFYAIELNKNQIDYLKSGSDSLYHQAKQFIKQEANTLIEIIDIIKKNNLIPEHNNDIVKIQELTSSLNEIDDLELNLEEWLFNKVAQNLNYYKSIENIRKDLIVNKVEYSQQYEEHISDTFLADWIETFAILILIVVIVFILKIEKNRYKHLAEQYKNQIQIKDKFFSIIAHDLKSPFNSMLGFSDILQENFDKYDDAKQKMYLGYIHVGINNTP